MCSPVIALGLTAASGIYTAVNQVNEGNASNKYYQYLAGQSEQEGRLAVERGQRQSEAIQNTASQNLKDVKTQGARVASSQRVALAANGIDPASVTAADIANSSFSQQQLDEMAVRYGADVGSWEQTEQAKYQNWQSGVQSQQYRYAGKNAKKAGKTQAFGTLIGTAATTGYQWNLLKDK